MGNLFSCPTTDVGHREDKEESGRRPTASPCNDASTSASELPSFPRIIDDKVNSGRRSRDFPYVGAQPSGTELAQRGETEPTMRRPKEVDYSDEYVV